MNENELHTSLLRGVICGLGCINHLDKAECLKMGCSLIHIHRTVRMSESCSEMKYEEICYSRVRSNEGFYIILRHPKLTMIVSRSLTKRGLDSLQPDKARLSLNTCVE